MTRKESEKFTPSNIFEGMTSISSLLNSNCGNNRKIERIWIDVEKRKFKAAQIGFLTAKSHELGFEIEFVSAEQINEIVIGNTHGGIIAFCSDRVLPSLTINNIIKKSSPFGLLF